MLKEYLFSAVMIGVTCSASIALAEPVKLATALVQVTGNAERTSYDGVVEAVRQTVVAAQVAGAVVALDVKVGDVVRADQVLLRIDARAANQNAAASDAQVLVARSSLELASKELARQRSLYQKQYISQAAFERAEAQFRATSAQVTAQLAQANAARTQSGFFVVKAPYAGVVAEVPVMLGEMAMPGRPLLTIYDPAGLRVTAAVPQTALVHMAAASSFKVELPGLPAERRWLIPAQVQVLPIVDAATHTAQLRVGLPAAMPDVTPGMFARVWLPQQAGAAQRLLVPLSAIVRRAELTGLYVIDQNQRPLLRQVRLGPALDGMVEILTGVSPGERVALDPQAAARLR